jgi:hypothetical protein
VTAQSTASAPPEDGRMGRPKHAEATSPNVFNKFLSVLNINVSWCFYTVYKCMGWNKQQLQQHAWYNNKI